jgi:hypothetical protein
MHHPGATTIRPGSFRADGHPQEVTFGLFAASAIGLVASCWAVVPTSGHSPPKAGKWPSGASLRLGRLGRATGCRARLSYSGTTEQMPVRSVQVTSHWIWAWKGVCTKPLRGR